MRSFSKLLAYVAETGGELALRSAARLAATTHARLSLADVMEDVPAFVARLIPRSWNVLEVVRAQKRAGLERSAARARRFGAIADLTLLRGDVVKALVGEVRRESHELLVVGVDTAQPTQSIGTTPVRLVRACPCPVLLVHASRRHRRRPRILVSIDVGPWRTNDADAFNARLLDVGRWFAERQDGELHVLHVWNDYVERFMRRGGVSGPQMKQFVSQAHGTGRRALELAIAPVRAHIADAHMHLAHGDPRKRIAAFASDHGVDLLVIGTVGRTGLAARAIGNTAEVVLSQLPCSMLVVRPESPTTRAGREAGEESRRSRGRLEKS